MMTRNDCAYYRVGECVAPADDSITKDSEGIVVGQTAAVLKGSQPATRSRCRITKYRLSALIVVGGAIAIIGGDVAAIFTSPRVTIRSRGASSRRPVVDESFPAPTTLKAWTEALAASAVPGPRVHAFVAGFPGGPAEKMAAIYARVAREWRYERDNARDWLTPAEVLAQPGMMRGDCKQIATLLYASAVDMGITARMVATQGNDGAAGHVHTEILLARPQEDPRGVLEVLSVSWKATRGRDATSRPAEYPLVWTDEGVFLILDGGLPPSQYQQQLGPVEAIVSSIRSQEIRQ